MHYELIVRPHGQEYRAICPHLPGVVGVGVSPGAALDAGLSALAAALKERGEPAPTLEVVRVTLAGAARI